MAVTVAEKIVKLLNSSGHALRIGYDASNYGAFQADSAGDLTVSATGGTIIAADYVAEKAGPTFDAAAFGASPAGSGSTNTTAIQAALDAANTAGGGTVLISEPGTYDLDEAGANPHDANNRYCLEIPGDNITLGLGPGVTLKLADGQQTDANGGVDIIVANGKSGIAVRGAGPGLSTITGNTAGQTGWSGGYSQGDVGDCIRIHKNAATDIIIRDLSLNDHFSHPVDIFGDENNPFTISEVHVENIETVDCGEGPLISSCEWVTMRDIAIEDPSAVMVGDGSEVSECDHITVENIRAKGLGASSSGAALDVHGCQLGTVKSIQALGWNQILQLQSSSNRDSQNLHISGIEGGESTGSGGAVVIGVNGRVCDFTGVIVDGVTVHGHTNGPALVVEDITSGYQLRNVTAYNCAQAVRIQATNNCVIAGILADNLTSATAIDISDEGASVDADLENVDIQDVVTHGSDILIQISSGTLNPGWRLRRARALGSGADVRSLVPNDQSANMRLEVDEPTEKTLTPSSDTLALDARAPVIKLAADLGELTRSVNHEVFEFRNRHPDTSNSPTIYDKSDASGTNINLSGSANITLGDGDSVTLRYLADTGEWWEIARTVV